MHGQFTSSRAQLRALGLKPRKRLSQSFLEDDAVADAIVDAAALEPTDEVLEVGPGLGVLTERLAHLAKRVVAVEVDRVLAEALPGTARVEVVVEDVLNFDPSGYFDGEYVVVANLPYHITSPALRHLLSARPKRMVVMVQAEVADRIAAEPGELSALAVSIQVQAEVQQVLRVPRTAFFPQPKVDSAVLRIDPLPEPLVAREQMDAFVRLVHAGFKQPRKTVRNSLAQGLAISTAQAVAVLQRAGIEPSLRPQAVGLEQWVKLLQVTR